ncbi:MAG: PTS sugar transporter subunit IIA [Deltaproteobacteria bacterium]|nr:PTS sugar transporter subunit IIA [Deltaproteobacteria bacterium]
MVGIVLATHGNLAEELVKVSEFIVGRMEQVTAVSIDPSQDVEILRKEIQKAIKRMDSGNGILILTDMFGGTPSNISLSFLEEGKIDVVTGVNLPMLMRLTHSREKLTLAEVAEQAKSYGRKGISQASEVLKK